MHRVKIKQEMIGESAPRRQYWHLILPPHWSDSERILCSGIPLDAIFDENTKTWEGEDGLKYIRGLGTITCPICLQRIQWFKNLR